MNNYGFIYKFQVGFYNVKERFIIWGIFQRGNWNSSFIDDGSGPAADACQLSHGSRRWVDTLLKNWNM